MGVMSHLTPETLRRFLDGTLAPAEARVWAEHLDQDCPKCEALLATEPATALDGVVDARLAALAPARPEERGDDLEYARIQRALKPRRAWMSRFQLPRLQLPRLQTLAAAAALLLVAGVAVQLGTGRTSRDQGWDGLKGIAADATSAVPVRLSAVAVLGDGGGGPQVRKVAGGDTVASSSALQVRVELGGPADLAVARIGPAGTVELIWHERVAGAGSVELTVDGRAAAYPLAGLSGSHRFVTVASAEPLSGSRLEAAVRALSRAPLGAQAPELRGISADVLEITVR
jgi:hypothetical protein